MIKQIIHVILISIMLTSCNCIKTSTKEKGLKHLVFLDLKEDLNAADSIIFIEQIQGLQNIKGLSSYEASFRLDTEDKRALKQFDFVIQTSHANVEDLNKYKADKIHLDVISNTKAYLAGPPSTFDYTIE